MIHNNKNRVGNFTSSEIVALLKDTKARQTYIDECNLERRLGRSLETESNARPLSWGNLVEGRVFELLGIEYQLVSDETIVHPTVPYWGGSPDAKKVETVGDIKCPITLKSFCQLVHPLYNGLSGMDAMNWIRKNHRDGEKYFQQLVSNSILTKSKFAELIVYCPYFSELLDIQQMAAPSMDAPKAANWIYYADHNELPWIPDGGHYKNLNVIRFEVPMADKIKLHEAVLEAGKELIEVPQLIAA